MAGGTKIYKLVKSIEYVSYPMLFELKRANEQLDEKLGNIFAMVLSIGASAFISFSLDASDLLPKVKWLGIDDFFNQWYVKFGFSLFLVGLVYFVIAVMKSLHRYCAGNKKTHLKRIKLYNEINQVILPEIIFGISLYKQAKESPANEKYKYAWQSYYYIFNALIHINDINPWEKDIFSEKLLEGSEKLFGPDLMNKEVFDKFLAEAQQILIDISIMTDIPESLKIIAKTNADSVSTMLVRSISNPQKQAGTVSKEFTINSLNI